MEVYRRLDFLSKLKSNLKMAVAFLVIAISILSGCSHTEKVLIPPHMALAPYRVIGVVEFSTNGEAELGQYLTQNYLQSVQNAQPDVRFLELGTRDRVLAKVHRKNFDFEAIRSIGRTYNVDAVMFGNLNLSKPKPDIHLSSKWESVKANATVEASLITKLWETDSGAVRWTNSSNGKDNIAHLSASTGGNIHFGAKDPKETYGKLIPQLVYANTRDFRARYEYHKVK